MLETTVAQETRVGSSVGDSSRVRYGCSFGESGMIADSGTGDSGMGGGTGIIYGSSIGDHGIGDWGMGDRRLQHWGRWHHGRQNCGKW